MEFATMIEFRRFLVSLFVFILCAACAGYLGAQESPKEKCASCEEKAPKSIIKNSEAKIDDDNTTAFQVTLSGDSFFGDEGYYQVNGVKIGLLASGGSGIVNGLELASFSSFTDTVRGMQTSVFANFAKYLSGFQAGLFNMVSEKGSFPVQAGIVNHARGGAFQFGLLNFMPDGALPFMIFINYSSGD